MSKLNDNVISLIIGFGAYYGLCWIFSFFPSFIIGLFISQHSEAEIPELVCLFWMIVFSLIILGLVSAKQFFIVVMLYVVTAWPFLNILIHYSNAEAGNEFPLPPVDWCFLF